MHYKEAVQAEILVIDDSLPYVESLHRDALRHGICVVHAGSLEEGKEKYGQGENPALAGIVLDVKCLKERRQQVPDSSFLAAAVHYFGTVARHLPMVILTGEPDHYKNLSELYAGTLRVYSKGRDEDAMLSFLAASAAKLDYLKIAGEHPEAFSAVRRHLGAEAERELVEVLREMNADELVAVKNTLVIVRRLQERMYMALSRREPGLLPPRLVAGEINIVGCYKHLAETGVVERYRIIDRFAELVYKITSDNGSHVPYQAPKSPPTRYTVQAVTYALLDLLVWFGRVMEELKTQKA